MRQKIVMNNEFLLLILQNLDILTEQTKPQETLELKLDKAIDICSFDLHLNLGGI